MKDTILLITNSTTINDENWTYSQQANTTENLDRSLSISIPVLTLNQINQQRPNSKIKLITQRIKIKRKTTKNQ